MPGDLARFDEVVRTERYFSATLLPHILLGRDQRGLTRFLELIESHSLTARGPDGSTTEYISPPLEYDLTDPEIITEFHIAQDLDAAGLLDYQALDRNKGQTKGAPDVVIMAGEYFVVCEAKFFDLKIGPSKLNAQLRSQRKQISLLFDVRPTLKAYRHIALLPRKPDWEVDCDGVVTWGEIAELSADVLGAAHYVTGLLQGAVARYDALGLPNGDRINYDGRDGLVTVLELCESEGDRILIGHERGEIDLRSMGMDRAAIKDWKWRTADSTRGRMDPKNWIHGSRFAQIIAEMKDIEGSGQPQPRSVRKTRVNNFDGTMSFQEIIELAKQRGNEIQIGFAGGLGALRTTSSSDLQLRRWKHRDPATNKGVIDPSRWFGGTDYLRHTQRAA